MCTPLIHFDAARPPAGFRSRFSIMLTRSDDGHHLVTDKLSLSIPSTDAPLTGDVHGTRTGPHVIIHRHHDRDDCVHALRSTYSHGGKVYPQSPNRPGYDGYLYKPGWYITRFNNT